MGSELSTSIQPKREKRMRRMINCFLSPLALKRLAVLLLTFL